MPEAGYRFLDFAKAWSWKPLPQQQSPRASPPAPARLPRLPPKNPLRVSPRKTQAAQVASPHKDHAEEIQAALPTGTEPPQQVAPSQKSAALPTGTEPPQQVAEGALAAMAGERKSLPTTAPASQLVSKDASIQKSAGKRNRQQMPKPAPPFSVDFAAQVGPFVTDYKRIESEKDQRNMLWKVLRYTHEAIPIPGVTGMLNALATEFGSNPPVIMTDSWREGYS